LGGSFLDASPSLALLRFIEILDGKNVLRVGRRRPADVLNAKLAFSYGRQPTICPADFCQEARIGKVQYSGDVTSKTSRMSVGNTLIGGTGYWSQISGGMTCWLA
jgi:hypothetical protein